ncbi:SGNH/GDSL hydrolase family protein [Lacticaseibacillus jixiensis]|uniref:SGNH/GDSL hydrolase family protein n=1 Tax=Lacticaseibacillus jixiensis TaxID=3231926 RepID=UPI0036F3B286
MKRVLLLGDSIRMGYQDNVKQLLQGDFDVIAPEGNGCDCSSTLWQVNQIFKHADAPFDVIHWNNGYWDMNIEAPMQEALHPLDEYVKYLLRLVPLLKAHTTHLIFANSLPVEREGESVDNSGTGAMIHYQNNWVKAYNKAAEAVMLLDNVPINDLYSLCLQEPGYYKSPDHLHLNDKGNQVLAEEIATVIRNLYA